MFKEKSGNHLEEQITDQKHILRNFTVVVHQFIHFCDYFSLTLDIKRNITHSAMFIVYLRILNEKNTLKILMFRKIKICEKATFATSHVTFKN